MNFSEDKFLPQSILYIFERLEQYNIFYWLDAGSLLKGVRDKSILSSSDIDISIFSDQIEDLLKALNGIDEEGYRVEYNGGYPMLEDLVTIFLPSSVNRIIAIDIYIYYKSEGSFIRRSFHKPIENSRSRHIFSLSKKILNNNKAFDKEVNFLSFNYLLKKCVIIMGKMIFFLYEITGSTLCFIIPEKYFSDFSQLRLYSRLFNIPKNYKKYLIYRYGDNWETPISRDKWFPIWKKEGSNILVSKKLSKSSFVKKYWI
jgi:phosphorylcholine metabolism protein LicD